MNEDVFVSVSSGDSVPAEVPASVSSGDSVPAEAPASVSSGDSVPVSVSPGDAAMPEGILCCCSPAVSSGDTVVEVDVTFPPEQLDELLSGVAFTNYLLSALLFFGICAWLESKVHKGIRRIFVHGTK